eukprot:3424213-Pleurochrysis_carterae.AAC.1
MNIKSRCKEDGTTGENEQSIPEIEDKSKACRFRIFCKRRWDDFNAGYIKKTQKWVPQDTIPEAYILARGVTTIPY